MHGRHEGAASSVAVAWRVSDTVRTRVAHVVRLAGLVRVQRKAVVVVGGGSGIGRRVVIELLRRGARVAAVDVRQKALESTVEFAEAGDRLVTLQARHREEPVPRPRRP